MKVFWSTVILSFQVDNIRSFFSINKAKQILVFWLNSNLFLSLKYFISQLYMWLCSRHIILYMCISCAPIVLWVMSTSGGVKVLHSFDNYSQCHAHGISSNRSHVLTQQYSQCVPLLQLLMTTLLYWECSAHTLIDWWMQCHSRLLWQEYFMPGSWSIGTRTMRSSHFQLVMLTRLPG